MRASRAYVASLGATGALLAFPLLLSLVLGALLAFRGGPADGSVDDADGVSLDGVTRLIEAPRLELAAGVSSLAEAAATTPFGRLSGGSREAGRRDGQGVAGVERRGGEGDPAGGSRGGSGEAGPAEGGAANGPQANSGKDDGGAGSGVGAGDGVTGTVQGLPGGAGSTAGEAAAPVAQVVQDTGVTVTGTVPELGSTVEGAPKPPKPPDLP